MQEILVMLIVLNLVVTAGFIGAFIVLMREFRDSRHANGTTSETLTKKVTEFDDITKLASEANNSIAKKIIDVSDKVDAMDERLAMLSGATTFKQQGSNPWQAKKPL